MKGLRLALVASLAAQPALAEPVLHEYIKPPAARSGRIVNGEPEHKPAAAGRDNPAAIRQGEKILVEPRASEAAQPSEVVLGAPGFAADRETEARPDYQTQADGTLHYVEVFNPSVVPFKRMSALDAVRPDYTLTTDRRALQPVAVGGDTSADRDLFWGSLVVDLPDDGGPVAVPSVAPDMRILSVKVEPAARVVFLRDGADNFYVRAVERRGAGRRRLVFLADAPAVYFAARVPAGVQLADAARARAPAALPARVRASAAIVLERVGVVPSMQVDQALGKLIEYFRGFQAGSPPPEGDDIYLDLALSRRGVCRHRAFAFMITANAAGIATRYVTNEAHAFAEVWVPEAGWLRVDLGGAALELDVANASDKAMHRPRGADPFPKPRPYADGYTRLRGTVDGLSREQIADAERPATAADPAHDPTSTDPVTAPRAALPRPEPAAHADARRRLPLVVDSVDRNAFRGEALRVSGWLGDGDGGPEGVRVDIYLAPAGTRGEGARVVGQTATDKRGRFAAAIELPLDLLLGKHEVYAVTPGSADVAPTISD